MTEEEKKATNNLWSSVTDVMFNVLYSQEDLQKDLKIALNLIQKQQKELEKQNNVINKISKNPFNTLTVDGITFAGTEIINILKIN